MRWFREMRQPALKCERLGHDVAVETRTGWTSSESWSHVMDKVRQERRACRRCGAILGDWVTVDRDGFHSVSWPTSMWDEYYANGNERWTNHGWRSLTPEDAP